MKELFTLIRERLLKKESLVLVTVTESSGSTPRGAGARMLAGKGRDGEGVRLWGSIGGGLPEHLAIEEAAALLSEASPETGRHAPRTLFKKYALHPDDAAGLGAMCGGEVSVFFRSLDPAEGGLLDVIEKGIASFACSKAAWFIMEIPDGALRAEVSESGKSSADFSLGIAGEDGLLCFSDAAPENPGRLLKAGAACLEEGGKLWLSEPLVSGGFVYVFGGGHVAQELVPLLAHLDFRCVVFDDREEFTKSELFPAAEKIILGDFKRIGNQVNLTERDNVVIVTRGHLWDLEAWAFALDSPAAYIGVIGSKTKHEHVKGRLRERGFSPASIGAARVHAPIGIDIKSETPAEIAVSIAGELVLCRARSRKEGLFYV